MVCRIKWQLLSRRWKALPESISVEPPPSTRQHICTPGSPILHRYPGVPGDAVGPWNFSPSLFIWLAHSFGFTSGVPCSVKLAPFPQNQEPPPLSSVRTCLPHPLDWGLFEGRDCLEMLIYFDFFSSEFKLKNMCTYIHAYKHIHA